MHITLLRCCRYLSLIWCNCSLINPHLLRRLISRLWGNGGLRIRNGVRIRCRCFFDYFSRLTDSFVFESFLLICLFSPRCCTILHLFCSRLFVVFVLCQIRALLSSIDDNLLIIFSRLLLLTFYCCFHSLFNFLIGCFLRFNLSTICLIFILFFILSNLKFYLRSRWLDL